MTVTIDGLGSAIAGAELSVPGPVELIDFYLVWVGYDGSTVVGDTTGLLGHFLSLADGSPEEVHRFATTWGPLFVEDDPLRVAAEHQRRRAAANKHLNNSDAPMLETARQIRKHLKAVKSEFGIDLRDEPSAAVKRYLEAAADDNDLVHYGPGIGSVSEYNEVAGHAQHLLRAYAYSRDNEFNKAEAELTEALLIPISFAPGPIAEVDLGETIAVLDHRMLLPTPLRSWGQGRNPDLLVGKDLTRVVAFLLEDLIAGFLNVGNAGNITCDANDNFQMVYRPSTVLGVLGLQLSVHLSGGAPPAICSVPDCMKLYKPTRKARRDQKNYCASCRDVGEPERFASAEYRRRKQEHVADR
ncbi:hypothetical protein OAG98_01790 [Acidimicrobiales bacterium]|nr:hypothetical protein [Acidimicrobiales bacterium]